MEKVVNILLVEDDNLDIIDVKRALDKMQIINRMAIAKNGEEAIQILNKNHPQAFDTKPDVVLVDINMPKMNGLEFLNVIRSSEEWKNLNCFIITTSEEKVDRDAAKKLGVSGFIVKPLKLNTPSSMDSFNLMIDLMNIKNGI
jgi:CheY-like chemotaxis protein